MTERIWTDKDYDAMSWHDNAIHGMRFIEGQDGCGELVLDIDYILEWIKVENYFTFRCQPATLIFRGVSDLRMTIDYASQSAGFSPFSIDGIERRSEQRVGYVAYLWKIPINWPDGEITFEATGFEQLSRGESRLTDAGALKPEERLNNPEQGGPGCPPQGVGSPDP